MRYVQLWAHPGCLGGKRAKQYLEHHGILYKETPLLEMNLPDHFLIISPIIRVGDHLLCGFDPEEFWNLYRKDEEDG